MHYGYDLTNQGDRIEFDAITYNADYFHLTDIDLNFFEATLGPSFNMKRIGWDKTRASTPSTWDRRDEVLHQGHRSTARTAGGGTRRSVLTQKRDSFIERRAIGGVATRDRRQRLGDLRRRRRHALDWDIQCAFWQRSASATGDRGAAPRRPRLGRRRSPTAAS